VPNNPKQHLFILGVGQVGIAKEAKQLTGETVDDSLGVHTGDFRLNLA